MGQCPQPSTHFVGARMAVFDEDVERFTNRELEEFIELHCKEILAEMERVSEETQRCILLTVRCDPNQSTIECKLRFEARQ